MRSRTTIGLILGLCLLAGAGCDNQVHITALPPDGDTAAEQDVSCDGVACATTPLCGETCDAACGCCTCTPGTGYCGNGDTTGYTCSDDGGCYRDSVCPPGTACVERRGVPRCEALPDGDPDDAADEDPADYPEEDRVDMESDGEDMPWELDIPVEFDNEDNGFDHNEADDEAFADNEEYADEADEGDDEAYTDGEEQGEQETGSGELYGNMRLQGFPVVPAAQVKLYRNGSYFTELSLFNVTEYHFYNLPAGSYRVTVTVPGTLEEAQDRSGVLAQDQILQLSDALFHPVGSIQVTVNLEGTTDLYGTSVYIPGTSYRATTNASGVAVLSRVPVGSWSVRMEHEGYAAYLVSGVEVDYNQTTYLLFGLDYVGTNDNRIGGGALYFNREDASSILVTLMDHYTGETLQTVHPSAGGAWAFDDLLSGSYDVSISADWPYQTRRIDDIRVDRAAREDVGSTTLRYAILRHSGTVEERLRYNLDRGFVLFNTNRQGDFVKLWALPVEPTFAAANTVAQSAYGNSINFIRDTTDLLYLYPYDAATKTATLNRADMAMPGSNRTVLNDIYYSYTYDYSATRLIYFRDFAGSTASGDVYVHYLDAGTDYLLGTDANQGIYLLSGMGDSGALLYTRLTDPARLASDLYFAPLDGSTSAFIAPDVYQYTLSFHPDGHHLAFYQVPDTSNYGPLLSVDLMHPRQPPGTVTDSGYVQYARFSNSGDRVFFWRNVSGSYADLYTLDIDPDTLAPREEPRRLVTGFFRYLHRFLSYEDGVLVFADQQTDGTFTLMDIDTADGSRSDLIQGVSNNALRASSDERYVFVAAHYSNGNGDILRIDRRTGDVWEAASDVYTGLVSIDSYSNRIIYFRNYSATEQSGEMYVRRMDPPGPEILVDPLAYFNYSALPGGDKLLILSDYYGGQGVPTLVDTLTWNSEPLLDRRVARDGYRMLGQQLLLSLPGGLYLLPDFSGGEPLLVAEKTPSGLSGLLMDSSRRMLWYVVTDPLAPEDVTPGLYQLYLP